MTAIFSQAQVNTVRHWEFGCFKLGASYPLTAFHGGDRTAGPYYGMEVRYNFTDSPWDIGLEWSLSNPVYKFNAKGETLEQWNATFGINLFGDYNFKQGAKFSPFVGLGVGYSELSDDCDTAYPVSYTTATFTPRAGIECWHFLRVTAFSQLNRKGFSNIGLSVGIVLGGTPVK